MDETMEQTMLSEEERMEEKYLERMYKAQLKAAQYNTPFLKAKSARQPSKAEIAEYRRLNKINVLHRNLMNTSKEIQKLEKELSQNLINTIGHKYRMTMRDNFVVEKGFETTKPMSDMKESIKLLSLISNEQSRYCRHLKTIIAENKEDDRAVTTAKAERGRIKSLMRITDHNKARRKYYKKHQPAVFDKWMDKVLDQKLNEVSNYSDVRQKIM